jgi:TRAP-type C4-dicarboxylate transport system substrate-binding protein
VIEKDFWYAMSSTVRGSSRLLGHYVQNKEKRRDEEMSSMKKLYVSMLVMVFVAGFIGVASAKEVVLRVAYPSADRGFAPEMIKWWGSNVEKRSGGKIKVEYYWGGLLGTSKEMLYSIERGTCDVGTIFPMYFEKELALATLNTCLIGTFINDGALTSKAWRQLAQEFPQIPGEWEARNQKLLMGWEVGPYLWMTKKPLERYDQLKGLKCGVWGGKGPRELFGQMGSIPIAIPSVEVYEALDKGTMDGRACTTPMMITYKYHEVCKYVTDVGLGTVGSPVYGMSMNLDTWKSMPPELQKVVLGVSKDWWAFFVESFDKAQKDDVAFLQGQGVTFLDFSEADKEKVRSLPVFEQYKGVYVERAKSKGHAPELAERIFARYKALIAEGRR